MEFEFHCLFKTKNKGATQQIRRKEFQNRSFIQVINIIQVTINQYNSMPQDTVTVKSSHGNLTNS